MSTQNTIRPLNPFAVAVETEKPWTVRDMGVNAISGVVNDPMHQTRTGTQKQAKIEVVSVPPTLIKRVKPTDFDPYVKTIKDSYSKYEINRAMGLEGFPALEDPLASPSHSSHGSFDKLMDIVEEEEARRSRSPSPTQKMLQSLKKTRPVQWNRMLVAKKLPPLEKLPSVFFDSNFNLADPQTFELIKTQLGDSYHSDVGLTQENNDSLQELLSHHLDTVEVHLIREISRRSPSFFAALTNLHDLHSETESSVGQIGQLRARLNRLVLTTSKQGLEVVRSKRRRANLSTLSHTIKTISELRTTQPMIQVLLNQGDYVGALDLIEGTTRLLRGSDQSVDLRGVKALIHMQGQLAEMVKTIGLLMECEFVNVLISDLRDTIRSIDIVSLVLFATERPTSGWAEALSSYDKLNGDQLRERLYPIVSGLIRMGRLPTALHKFKEQVITDMKAMTNKFHQSSPDKPDDLAHRLKALSFDAFIDMLLKVYITDILALQHIAAVNNVLLKLTGDVDKNLTPLPMELKESSSPVVSPPSTSPKLDDELDGLNVGVAPRVETSTTKPTKISQLLDEMLYSLIEVASLRCAKLLAVRSEQTSHLNLKDYLRLYNITNDFIDFTNKKSPKPCPVLKLSLATQSKTFLHRFHDDRIRHMTQLVDNEVWQQAIVPVEFQKIADSIIAYGTARSLETTEVMPDDDDEEETGTPEKQRFLLIDDRKYYVVGSALMLTRTLSDYLESAQALPALTFDVLQCILELIANFNNRVCQVILGAGAVNTAGLKTITAKHLALASQALGVVLGLLPHLEAFFTTRLPQRSQVVLAGEFDKKKKDLQEHQSQIYAKLVSIMNDRLTVHLRAMAQTDFDALGTNSQESPYIITIVKDLTTLHKVLSKYLLPSTLKHVMTETLKTYQNRLEEDVKKLTIYTPDGKHRLLADMQYFIINLALPGLDPPGSQLEVVANNFSLSERPIAPERISTTEEGRNSTTKALPEAPARSSMDTVRTSFGHFADLFSKTTAPVTNPSPKKATPAGMAFMNKVLNRSDTSPKDTQ